MREGDYLRAVAWSYATSLSAALVGLLCMGLCSGCSPSMLQRQATAADATAEVVNGAGDTVRAWYAHEQFEALRAVCSPAYVDALEAAVRDGDQPQPWTAEAAGCTADEWDAAVAPVREAYRPIARAHDAAREAHEAWRQTLNEAIRQGAEDAADIARAAFAKGEQFLNAWNALAGMVLEATGTTLPLVSTEEDR